MGTVIKGKFYRSGEPVGLSAEDIYDLENKYKIKHIFDFRKAVELERKPIDTFHNIQYHHLDIMKEAKEDASFKSMLEVTGDVFVN